jgi:hypothetical protein
VLELEVRNPKMPEQKVAVSRHLEPPVSDFLFPSFFQSPNGPITRSPDHPMTSGSLNCPRDGCYDSLELGDFDL